MNDAENGFIEEFQKNFNDIHCSRMVIYGIGKNTEAILKSSCNYNIIGLMDEVRTGEYIYDKKIISMEEALAGGVELIVIVATQANTRIIYRRISEFCEKNNIPVYNVRGEMLGKKESKNEQKDINKYANITLELLKEKILQADIVSFDIFDTLLMRKTLYPHDVFLLIEEETGKTDFAKSRIMAEKELYSEGLNPDIGEIYERLQSLLDLTDGERESLKDAEITAEAKNLIPRDEMVKALEFARSEGKSVFFVSDMYLPKEILSKILKMNGIEIDQSNLLVSCDFGVPKSGGLFNMLRKLAGEGKILHIGDNEEADGVSAKKYGVEDTFLIYSSEVMLEDSFGEGMLKYVDTLPNRMIIGQFISKQLNSPFLFEKTNGKFFIDNDCELAYSFLSPIILKFFVWMIDKAKELELDCLLLGARDGWIFEKISELLQEKLPDSAETRYFYTSRSAALIAGISTDEEIFEISKIAYKGNSEGALRDRFKLKEEEIKKRDENEPDKAYILRHKQAILRNVERTRNNYLTYLKKLNLGAGTKVGFMDFVSSGSCQYGLSKFSDFEICGLYFMRNFDECKFKNNLNIKSLFDPENYYFGNSIFGRSYLFLENIITSDEPSLQTFDENGEPIFEIEQRTKEQINALHAIHEAIFDFVKSVEIQYYRDADRDLLELLFLFLSENYCVLSDECNSFVGNMYDEFSHRNFAIERPSA